MKVLVATDRIGRLSPAEASDVVATAFQGQGADVAVAPVATGGADLVEMITRFAPEVRVTRPGGLDQLLAQIRDGVEYLDLTGLPPVGIEELAGLPILDLAAAPVAVVAPQFVTRPLTGLTGALAEQGRTAGTDLAEILAVEARATAWLQRIGQPDVPGCGVQLGLGAWLMRCGIRVATGLEVAEEGYDLPRLAGLADLVVTGADTLDFHRRGGEVVRELTRIAGQALTPVVVVCGRNFVSARELRHTGIEEAHAVHPGADGARVRAEELRHLATRVATTWRW